MFNTKMICVSLCLALSVSAWAQSPPTNKPRVSTPSKIVASKVIPPIAPSMMGEVVATPPKFQKFIGKSRTALPKNLYVTMAGCASEVLPNLDKDPKRICQFQIELFASSSNHTPEILLLSHSKRTHFDRHDHWVDDGTRDGKYSLDYDDIYTSLVAFEPLKDPRYTFGIMQCSYKGKSTPSVFGYFYDKDLEANARDPLRNKRHMEVVKAWKVNEATKSLHVVDPKLVTCKAVTY